MMTGSKSEQDRLLYLSVTPWQDIRQRSQHLARIFAETNRIAYCHPYVTAFGTTKKPANDVEVDPVTGIYLISPQVLPLRRLSVIRNTNRQLLKARTGTILSAIEFTPDRIWISDPNQAPILDEYPGVPIVYDCQDDYPHFYSGRMRAEIEKCEQQILQRADTVFTISTKLAARLAAVHPNVHVVPNGVEIEHFATVRSKTVRAADELADIVGPIAGYYGTLNWWFDWDTLIAVAEARHDWTYVLVGPWQGEKRTLPPNIRAIGPQPYERLPEFLSRFDVAIMPFIDHEMIKSVDPLKIYEYMAAGKPVVTSRLPAIEKFGSVLRFYDSVRTFIDGIESWLKAPPSLALQQEMLDFAEANSWKRRAKEIEQALQHTREYHADPAT